MTLDSIIPVRWRAVILYVLIILLPLFFIPLLLDLMGRNARTFSSVHVITRVRSPRETTNVLRKTPVFGRVMFYFDRHLSADEMLPEVIKRVVLNPGYVEPITSDNFLYALLHSGVIREIYHVIPERSWKDVVSALSTRPGVAFDGRIFRFTIEGYPIIVSRVGDLPRLEEKVIVYVNEKLANEYSQKLTQLTSDDKLCDVVLLQD